MKKIIAIIVILAIVIFIGVKMSKSPAPVITDDSVASTTVSVATSTSSVTTTSSTTTVVTTTTASSTTAHTVTYTDAGYSPASITIKVGESVTFINNSTGKIWTASDPHPQHTILSSFDEKTAADPGTSWTYTFTKAGAWKYHNHKKSSFVGQVIVQ